MDFTAAADRQANESSAARATKVNVRYMSETPIKKHKSPEGHLIKMSLEMISIVSTE